MSESRYMISEAAKITQVEAHVLRYWEEELKLPIARNEMGHRYYTQKDIQTFQNIKELKKQGLQLKHIKERIHPEEKATALPKVVVMRTAIEKEKTKEERFEEIMEKLFSSLEEKENTEGRFRRLDVAIRQRQQTRKMAAATEENTKKRKKRFFSVKSRK